ncbi:MAG: hypothetical protein NHG14_00170 [Candidatus Shikimatogenerans bostrichidophilus]|nr:MAG: hypothetical protein NHG14_00170 [Candidatus Shikimatogenerans bostrichidophilus]
MKLFLSILKTKKTINIFLKEKKYSFILNKKNINKIKLKEYFLKNYNLKVNKINIIKNKYKKKIKIIVKFNKINKKKIYFQINKNEVYKE